MVHLVVDLGNVRITNARFLIRCAFVVSCENIGHRRSSPSLSGIASRILPLFINFSVCSNKGIIKLVSFLENTVLLQQYTSCINTNGRLGSFALLFTEAKRK